MFFGNRYTQTSFMLELPQPVQRTPFAAMQATQAPPPHPALAQGQRMSQSGDMATKNITAKGSHWLLNSV